MNVIWKDRKEWRGGSDFTNSNVMRCELEGLIVPMVIVDISFENEKFLKYVLQTWL
jgi:hypothetical protein